MIRQGDIYTLYLDPVQGSEQAGRRPAIIISGNLLNQNLNTVIVIPLTTKIKHYYGNPILAPDEINGLLASSEAMVLHVRSVDKRRLKDKLGKVDAGVVSKIKETLSDILTL